MALFFLQVEYIDLKFCYIGNLLIMMEEGELQEETSNTFFKKRAQTVASNKRRHPSHSEDEFDDGLSIRPPVANKKKRHHKKKSRDKKKDKRHSRDYSQSPEHYDVRESRDRSYSRRKNRDSHSADNGQSRRRDGSDNERNYSSREQFSSRERSKDHYRLNERYRDKKDSSLMKYTDHRSSRGEHNNHDSHSRSKLRNEEYKNRRNETSPLIKRVHDDYPSSRVVSSNDRHSERYSKSHGRSKTSSEVVVMSSSRLPSAYQVKQRSASTVRHKRSNKKESNDVRNNNNVEKVLGKNKKDVVLSCSEDEAIEERIHDEVDEEVGEEEVVEVEHKNRHKKHHKRKSKKSSKRRSPTPPSSSGEEAENDEAESSPQSSDKEDDAESEFDSSAQDSSADSQGSTQSHRPKDLYKIHAKSRFDSSTEESETESESQNDTSPGSSPGASSFSSIDEPKEDVPKLPYYYPAKMGCRNVSEFWCLNRIEEGTYGVVYRAEERCSGRKVALKRLKMEKEKDGFPITSIREVSTLLKAKHKNVVDVQEIVVGSNVDKIYIVMEYVEHDLKTLMDTMKEPFLVGEVKTLMIQLLRGLHHLHDNWILHRDLKTSNLLLSHNGILKIGDFGLAREYGSPLRRYTPVVVTLWYRCPELLLGEQLYSTAVDMWSVGCIMGELLQRKALMPGKSEKEQITLIFTLLGKPNDTIWPGYSKLPLVAAAKELPAGSATNQLGKKFGVSRLGDGSIALMNR